MKSCQLRDAASAAARCLNKPGRWDLKGRELSLQPRRGDAPHGRVHGGEPRELVWSLHGYSLLCSSQASEAQLGKVGCRGEPETTDDIAA